MNIVPITLKYLFETNCYLLRTDDGFFLVDTGIKKNRQQLENELAKAGCRLGDLKLIIVTHGHLDHVGNAVYLRDKYGAKIAMHREDARMTESGDMFIDAKGGILIGIVGALMKLFGLSDYEVFTPDLFIEDKQDLTGYGLHAAVIYSPGHSKGSISLITGDGELFCGDLFDNTKKPEIATLIDDRAMLEISVDKVLRLNPVRIFPGHGKPFKAEEISA